MIEDYLRSIRQHYYNMPDWQKKIIGSTYNALPTRVRYGKYFTKFEALLEKSRYFSRDEIEYFQFLKIKETLEIAFNHVPFYQKKYSEYGLSLNSFKEINDIQKFPLLEKKDVKDNYYNLINPTIAKNKHLITTTGGSTAEPMRFLHIKGLTRSKEKVFITDGWKRAGYSIGDKVVQLKGRSVGNPSKNIFWEHEYIQNYLEMDSNYLSDKNIPFFLNKMNDFKPEFIIAFPSSIYLIAKYIKKHNLKVQIPTVRSIFLASENVYSWQRKVLEEVFKCRIFSHYGHSEMLLLGMECEDSHSLHFFPEYGYLELLDKHGQYITQDNGIGEIVGTSFDNNLMPFIRYKTQDFGVHQKNPCTCGRNYSILKDVEGRMQEFLVTKDERLISITTMGAAHFDILDTVSETQYYQDKKGEIIFKIVPKNDFTEKNKESIKKAIEEKTGKGCKVEVKIVDGIKRTKSGKHMMLDQKLDLDVLFSQDHVLTQSGDI